MGIYLPNIEMPKACNILKDQNCPLFVAATVSQVIDCAPAIIPADKEEDNG